MEDRLYTLLLGKLLAGKDPADDSMDKMAPGFSAQTEDPVNMYAVSGGRLYWRGNPMHGFGNRLVLRASEMQSFLRKFHRPVEKHLTALEITPYRSAINFVPLPSTNSVQILQANLPVGPLGESVFYPNRFFQRSLPSRIDSLCVSIGIFSFSCTTRENCSYEFDVNFSIWMEVVAPEFYWPRMAADIAQFVANCSVCAAPLQPSTSSIAGVYFDKPSSLLFNGLHPTTANDLTAVLPAASCSNNVALPRQLGGGGALQQQLTIRAQDPPKYSWQKPLRPAIPAQAASTRCMTPDESLLAKLRAVNQASQMFRVEPGRSQGSTFASPKSSASVVSRSPLCSSATPQALASPAQNALGSQASAFQSTNKTNSGFTSTFSPKAIVSPFLANHSVNNKAVNVLSSKFSFFSRPVTPPPVDPELGRWDDIRRYKKKQAVAAAQGLANGPPSGVDATGTGDLLGGAGYPQVPGRFGPAPLRVLAEAGTVSASIAAQSGSFSPFASPSTLTRTSTTLSQLRLSDTWSSLPTESSPETSPDSGSPSSSSLPTSSSDEHEIGVEVNAVGEGSAEESSGEASSTPASASECETVLLRYLAELPNRISVTPTAEAERREAVDELQNILSKMLPMPTLLGPPHLRIFGSLYNGFDFLEADVDVNLTFIDHQKFPLAVCTREYLVDQVKTILSAHPNGHFQQVFSIATARVPIVKCRHARTSTSLDISIYNNLPIYNSQLLACYAKLDPRVKLLGYALKYAAKTCNICDASKGGLCSYTYIILVIYFLQQCDPPVLPVLQEVAGHAGCDMVNFHDIDGWRVKFCTCSADKIPNFASGANTKGVCLLLLELLDFYAHRFDYATSVVCIRRRAPVSKEAKMWTDRLFAVEDPFELTHNLSGLKPEMFKYIQEFFKNAYHAFSFESVHSWLSTVPSNHRNDISFGISHEHFTAMLKLKEPPPDYFLCFYCNCVGHMPWRCVRAPWLAQQTATAEASVQQSETEK